MKKSFYITSILLISCNLLSAQQRITVSVKSEASYDKILPPEMIYEFTEYQNGRLYYKSGTVTNNKFNYNLITNALLFKNKAGNELELAFPEQVTMVMIDSCYWVPINNGFGKIIYNKDSLDLIKYRKTNCTDIRKEGAFGGVSSTSAVTSITSIQGAGNTKQTLTVIGEYDFEVALTYYLKKDEMEVIADTKGFKKIFPQNKNIINGLIKSKNLDLSKEKDIIELINLLTKK